MFGRTFVDAGSDFGDGDSGLGNYTSKRFKKPEAVTLLEHTRLRNMGKSDVILLPNVMVILKT